MVLAIKPGSVGKASALSRSTFLLCSSKGMHQRVNIIGIRGGYTWPLPGSLTNPQECSLLSDLQWFVTPQYVRRLVVGESCMQPNLGKVLHKCPGPVSLLWLSCGNQAFPLGLTQLFEENQLHSGRVGSVCTADSIRAGQCLWRVQYLKSVSAQARSRQINPVKSFCQHG